MSERLAELVDLVVPVSEQGRPDWDEVLGLAAARQPLRVEREVRPLGAWARRRWWRPVIILAVAAGVAVGGVAVAASWDPFSGHASLPRKPIVENAAAFARVDLRLTAIPSTLAKLPGDTAPKPGTVRELATGLGQGNMAVYAWPSGGDRICFQTSLGSGGCQTEFFGDASLAVSDPDRVGAGLPAYVWGLVSDAVIGVNVVVAGTSHPAVIRNNVAFFELEGDAHPSAVKYFTVSLKGGAIQTIDY